MPAVGASQAVPFLPTSILLYRDEDRWGFDTPPGCFPEDDEPDISHIIIVLAFVASPITGTVGVKIQPPGIKGVFWRKTSGTHSETHASH